MLAYHSERVSVALRVGLVRVQRGPVGDGHDARAAVDDELVAGAALYAVHHSVVRRRAVCVAGFDLYNIIVSEQNRPYR